MEEHIKQKKEIYYRYRDGLKGLPVRMNPIPEECEPNYWLSCLIIDKDAMCQQVRGEKEPCIYQSIENPARLRSWRQ